MSIKGSTRFQAISDRVTRLLTEYSRESSPPDARTLRKFAMREAADFLGVKQNTFRHYVSSMSDRIPTGELDKSNRRYFTLEEIHEIQRVLFREGKTDPKAYPRRQGDEPCVAITCLSLRKGTGASSLSAHTAANLALLGYRVLCCDLDPQASLTNMFGVTPALDLDMLTASDMTRDVEPVPAQEVIQKTYFPNIDLIPAPLDLMGFEYEAAPSSRNPALLAHVLEPVMPNYDVVIFDTPPELGVAVFAALFASRGVLIPLNAAMQDVISLANVLSMAGNMMEVLEARTHDHGLDFVKLLITRYEDADRSQVQVASFLRTALGDAVMTAEFVETTAAKQSLFEVEPRGTNRKIYDRAIESIRWITAEVETEISKARGRTGP